MAVYRLISLLAKFYQLIYWLSLPVKSLLANGLPANKVYWLMSSLPANKSTGQVLPVKSLLANGLPANKVYWLIVRIGHPQPPAVYIVRGLAPSPDSSSSNPFDLSTGLAHHESSNPHFLIYL